MVNLKCAVNTDKFQYVALPIPEYLVNFLCGKLRVASEDMPNGAKATALPITRRSFLGELIHSNLKVCKTIDKNPSNFYLKIADAPKRERKDSQDTRYHIVKLPPSKYLLIEKLLRNSIEIELVAYVSGCHFAHQKIKGTKKGLTHQAIYDFMLKNGVPISESTFETFKKIYYRGRKSPKALKTLMV